MNIFKTCRYRAFFGVLSLATMLTWPVAAQTPSGQPNAAQTTAVQTTGARFTADQDAVWNGGLRSSLFGDRPIVESDELIELDAPTRAENAAVVPIAIKAKIRQTEKRYIKTVWLIADRNPGPVAGKFQFSPSSGRADLELRVRLNEYTPVRAIAETSDGELHMSRRFVKASGGCSAPAGTDLDAALARLGKMKIKTLDEDTADGSVLAQLLVSHPNINGLQMDQLTGLYMPAHFVRHVRVSFEGVEIFSAETSFAISENPSFRFYFVPDRAGELTAQVVDTEGLEFSHVQAVSPRALAAQQTTNN